MQPRLQKSEIVMLPAERRRKMAQMINEQGAVNTRDLAEALGISIMTVRRDLKTLEEQKQLKLTWGGAVPLGFQAHDIPYENKSACMTEAKIAIARAAIELIDDDSFIALDAGTTTLELARLLITLPKRISVVTPDLEIAMTLTGHAHISVYLAGGELDPVSRACHDSDTAAYLRLLQTTLAFMGTNVWDAGRGITTSSSNKMHLKRRLLESARRCVLLADSSKYANFSPWRIAGVEEFETIITDTDLPADARRELGEAGARLRYANI